MNQKLSFTIATLIVVLFVQSLWAQTPAKTPVNKVATQRYPVKKKWATYRVDTIKNTDFSLAGQYQFMLSRSKTVNGYKLVNPTRLAGVWQSVTDTLRKERAELKSSKVKLAEQDKTVKSLQAEINGQESSINSSNAKMNEISFLGISFEKSTYHMIVWSIILILAIALLVVIVRSTKNILEAKHRTSLYDEISAEYQAFKTKSNEQQRKLARELQDERNIVEELKGRS